MDGTEKGRGGRGKGARKLRDKRRAPSAESQEAELYGTLLLSLGFLEEI